MPQKALGWADTSELVKASSTDKMKVFILEVTVILIFGNQ
jgi:hypothetical protein